MLNFLRRLIQRYGLFRRDDKPTEGLAEFYAAFAAWESDAFFTEEKRRNERLAAIARERDALKEAVAKAKRQKKAVAPIYQALRALSVEELNLEAGR